MSRVGKQRRNGSRKKSAGPIFTRRDRFGIGLIFWLYCCCSVLALPLTFISAMKLEFVEPWLVGRQGIT